MNPKLPLPLSGQNANRACQDQPMFEVPKRTHVGQHPCIAQSGPSKQKRMEEKIQKNTRHDVYVSTETSKTPQTTPSPRHPGGDEASHRPKEPQGLGKERNECVAWQTSTTSVHSRTPSTQRAPQPTMPTQPPHPGSTTQEKSDRSASDTPMTATPKSGAAFIAMPMARTHCLLDRRACTCSNQRLTLSHHGPSRFQMVIFYPQRQSGLNSDKVLNKRWPDLMRLLHCRWCMHSRSCGRLSLAELTANFAATQSLLSSLFREPNMALTSKPSMEGTLAISIFT